jgi:hypothetical protein
VPVVVFSLALIAHGRALRAQEDAGRVDDAPPIAATGQAPGPSGGPSDEAEEGASEGPSRVTVGLYLHHVPELDLPSSSYLADLCLWLLWRGEPDPIENFEITNLVEGWDLMQTPL